MEKAGRGNTLDGGSVGIGEIAISPLAFTAGTHCRLPLAASTARLRNFFRENHSRLLHSRVSEASIRALC
jgi:hypothetical protein